MSCLSCQGQPKVINDPSSELTVEQFDAKADTSHAATEADALNQEGAMLEDEGSKEGLATQSVERSLSTQESIAAAVAAGLSGLRSIVHIYAFRVGQDEIPEAALGPALDAMHNCLPDWRRWEGRDERWVCYRPKDAITIERYWQYFAANERGGTGTRYIARLRLGGNKTSIVNFRDSVLEGSSRRFSPIVRRQLPGDWLSNSYFLGAFRSVCGLVELSQPFDINSNEDFRDMELSLPLHSAFPKLDIVVNGKAFKPPLKWKRFAVNVHGLGGGNLQWCQKRGPGTWDVAYLGINKESLPQILLVQFGKPAAKPSAEETSCASSLEVAEKDARTEYWDGHAFQMVLQLRVRPTAAWPEASAEPYRLVKSMLDVRIDAVLVRGGE